jgi:hypothetical protein
MSCAFCKDVDQSPDLNKNFFSLFSTNSSKSIIKKEKSRDKNYSDSEVSYKNEITLTLEV